MRALGLLLSLCLHLAVALLLPAQAQRREVAPAYQKQPLVWLVQPHTLRRLPRPEFRAALASQVASTAPTPALRQAARAAPMRRTARNKSQRAAAPSNRPPQQLVEPAPLAVAGVEVPETEEFPPPAHAPLAVDSALRNTDNDGGLPGSGTSGERGAGAGDPSAELDGRGGDANPMVADWLRALRAHLRRCHHYPDWLLERGLEGTVELRLVIYADGRLGEVAPVGTGNALLVQAAKEVLADAGRLPKPPELLGSAVRVRMPLTFRLEGQ